ncbi:hypothetical protein BZG36_00626 [Bifiguratus adelaidae]|uniref:Glycosyl hydrolase family 30 TIM-barrel domain-containing protein n=1 Tax=Bifiguratus adelaidae TaxID=1938954 RepID=A0A261Y7I2_9FUNG|nr:hypothetical protein BZG36_00626 [Bifiguratus adelaidae]
MRTCVAALLLAGLTVISPTSAQSIQSIGTSGGNGPKGGIGDCNHPVTTAQAFVTDAVNSEFAKGRQLAKDATPKLLQKHPGGNVWDVVVNAKSGARQEMLGFGHAWTDSTVDVFNQLDADVLDKLMKELYGQDGNNMGLMRHTIGSSDLSGEQYSYDDNGPSFNEGSPDKDLAHFDIGYYGERQAKMIAKMGSYKSDVTLFGSPWSAPSWMKYNGLFIAPNRNVPGGGSYMIANNSFNIDYFNTYAQYFGKYVDAFAKYNVTINAITPQNEPLNYQGGYPCMYLEAADEASLINNGLGEEMKKRGVGIWAYDHNTDQSAYPQRVITGAPGQVQAAAWHCYASPANYTVMSDFHDNNPDIPQFMTECADGSWSSGPHNFVVASNFMEPVTNWGSGAAMWVMATNASYGPHCPYGGCGSCIGSVIVYGPRNYTLTNQYYMIGQFSRYIRRGAINYEVTKGISGTALTNEQFYVNAIKNPDGSWAIVMMNNSNKTQNVVVELDGEQQYWQATVPEFTLNTWLLPAKKSACSNH